MTVSYLFSMDRITLPSRRALAEAAVNAAARLRPEAGETHLARADVLYRCYLDYDGARSSLTLAQRSLPNNAQVLIAYRLHRSAPGSVERICAGVCERALELDPRNWFYLEQISLSYQFLRALADMAAALDRVLAIIPDDVARYPCCSRCRRSRKPSADLRPLRETIDAALQKIRLRLPVSQDLFIYFALC